MRTRNWLASVLSGYLAVAGGVAARGQEPPFSQYGPGNPDAIGMLPAPYNSNYGAPPSNPGMASVGYPEGANQWPYVSPYMGPAVDSHRYEDGFWFNKQYMGGKKFHFSVDAIFGHTQINTGTSLGARGVNDITPFLPPGQVAADHNQQFVETTINVADDMPNRSVLAAGGQNSADIPIFVTQKMSRLPDNLDAGGLRAQWGWWNADKTGIQITGFWQDKARSSFLVGTGYDYDPAFASFADYNERHIRAFAGIPLGGRNANGSLFDPDDDLLYGVVQPFDLYYRVRYDSDIMGSTADWFGSPILERKSLTIRPVAAGRVMKIRELFRFDGADSGMGYTINPAAATNGNGNNANSNVPYSPAIFEPGFNTPDVMYSELNSSVRSILAGPEAGLRFDLGGDKFSITTQSKFGVLVNNSERNLNGFNIGDAIYVTGGRTTPIMPRNDQDETSFKSHENRTSISPMFEQSISMKTKPFGTIPYLNRAKMLTEAEFNFGYTWLLIGQVYRPASTINWDSYPTNPSLADKKMNYVNGSYNFGLEWNY